MGTNKDNAFTYTGSISEIEEPLTNKSGAVLGHSVSLATMGSTLRFFLPERHHAKPDLGQNVTVTGHLIPAASGWPKVKVTGVKSDALQPSAAGKGGA